MESTRAYRPFEVVSEFTPSGDQPKALDELEAKFLAGESDVTLLGATGTGKSATTAWLIERLQRPALVLAHNKTLAAQLANELREMLPHNAVEYFVSYYDYYQPEAYVPQTDTFIEKDSSINAEVERLRHSTTNSLLSRRDVVVVSTVSCIFGLGAPEDYYEAMLALQVGQKIKREELIKAFVSMQYERNDIAFERGTFRVRGDTLEIIPVYEELALRIEMFGDEIESLASLHPITGETLSTQETVSVFPATHYAASAETMKRAVTTIRAELEERVLEFERAGKLLEAQRIRMRTTYDLEMMEQLGFCSGIENYSRHIDGRAPGEAPSCLLDYFPKTSSPSSMNLTSPSRRWGECMRATPPARERWSNTVSGYRARWITGRCVLTSFSKERAKLCIYQRHRANTSSVFLMVWWSRLLDRPVLLILRSW